MSRPFVAIRYPNNFYDAVVIGAGIGGLVCANLLARAGLRTLLLESHYMVGGYCSTFRRGPYTFDAATHFYPLLGNPTTLTGRVLADLGVRTHWVKMDPVDQFHFPDGSAISVPADIDSYLSLLRQQFPAEAEPIDSFFALVRHCYRFGLVHYFKQCLTDRLAEQKYFSVRDVLERFFKSPKLKLLLTADCSHWGSPPSRVSFIFDSMLRLAYFLGNYYPSGGSQAFADELARLFADAGGHILLRARADRILLRAGTADGVQGEVGPEGHRTEFQVRTDVVVSNADLRQTVECLLPPGSVDPAYQEWIRALRPTSACSIFHFGLRDVHCDQLQAIDGYHWESWDAEEVASRAFKIFVPTLYESQMAPPGHHVLIVQKISGVDFDGVTDWDELKRNEEEWVSSRLTRLIPDFSSHVEVKAVASALTSYRYTLNQRGAMLGWEMSPKQIGEWRPDVTGPVRNLYCVGHWVQPGGGITPVMISAIFAAKKITQSAACEFNASTHARPPAMQAALTT